MADRAMLIKHVGILGTAPISDLFGENAPVIALPEETCRIVATRLAVHHLERLPVVKDADSLELLGLVARSDLIKPSLSLFDEEHHYEQVNQTPFSGLRQAFRRR